MNESERYRLWWLSQQGRPMWGDDPITNPEIKAWLDAGLITLSDNGKGYVVTAKGLASLTD